MITKLILKQYIPLATKGVEYVELDLSAVINVIIGRNGHGKSRLLAELNELPPDNKNFKDGGYKYVETTHHGKHYILESYTGSKSKHSFKEVGGEELNPGGTQAVQKELVKRVLGIEPFTSRVLSGLRLQDRFTVMPKAVRKDFFMEMYPNDTDEAMHVFNKMKSGLNDTVGAIRNQTQRLAEEQQRAAVIESKTPEELEQEVRRLDERIADALYLQGGLSNAKNVSPELEEKINLLKNTTERLISFELGGVSLTRQDVLKQIESLTSYVQYHGDNVRRYQEMFNDLATNLSGMNLTENDPKVYAAQQHDLQQRLDHVNEELRENTVVLAKHPALLELFDEDKTLAFVAPDFVSVLNNLPLAGRENLTVPLIRKKEAEFDEVMNAGRAQKEIHQELSHFLKHYDSQSDVACPECHAEFKPGFDKGEVESKRLKLRQVRQAIETLKVRHDELKRFLEDTKEWDNGMRRLTQFITNHSDMSAILNKLVTDYDIGYGNPDLLINGLRSFARQVKLTRQEVELRNELSVITGRLNVLKRNNMEDSLVLYARLESLLASSTTSLDRCEGKLQRYKNLLDDYNAYDFRLDQLSHLRESILELLAEEGRYALKRQVELLISDFSPQKEQLITALIRKQSSQSVVQSIEDNLSALKVRQRRLKILTDGLCPKKGLIGKLLLDFITAVCGNMNAIIQEVWSTPLFIRPCMSDKGVLDYQFPVLNGIDSSYAEDISDCSGGESEIIDFAFRLTMWKYHPTETEFFLDEIGIMMDEYHRRRFFDYVQRIGQNGDINRMYLVSHYLSQYGMLNGANLIALNTEGLTVPGNLNQHSVIR